MLGSGIGGAGGTNEGGCVCVCSMPTCMPSNVIAGIAGNSAAIGAVSPANALSISCCGAPTSPSTPPSPCATQPAAPCSGGGAFMNGAAAELTASPMQSSVGLPVGAINGGGAGSDALRGGLGELEGGGLTRPRGGGLMPARACRKSASLRDPDNSRAQRSTASQPGGDRPPRRWARSLGEVVGRGRRARVGAHTSGSMHTSTLFSPVRAIAMLTSLTVARIA
jgi:hypothetical protein